MIKKIKSISRIVLAIIFIVIGIAHCIFADTVIKLVPQIFPVKLFLVYLSGVLAFFLGVLLRTKYKKIAAWAMVAWMVAVFPANIYHYFEGPIDGVPDMIQQSKSNLLWRLPIQILYVIWPFWHTKD